MGHQGAAGFRSRKYRFTGQSSGAAPLVLLSLVCIELCGSTCAYAGGVGEGFGEAQQLACYEGFNTHGAPPLSLPAAMQSRLRTDILTLYQAQVGKYPSDGPAQVVGWQAPLNASTVSSWRNTSTAFIAAHAAAATADVKALVPAGFTGLLVLDYESWQPLLGLNNPKDSSVRDWYAGLAALHSPAFDASFLNTVGWKAPAGTTGWPSLPVADQQSLADAGWTYFSAEVWNTSIAAIRSGAAAAGAAAFKLGFWNKPIKFWNAGVVPPGWMDQQRRLGWLWGQLDVFMPDLYPEAYAGPASQRPAGMHARCVDVNASTSDAYIRENVAVSQQLRDEFAPGVPVLIYTWYHYMCDPNTTYFADTVSINSQFAAAAAAGADGLVIWGSSGSYVGEDHNASVVEDFLARAYAPFVEQYCSDAE